jgi:hypothetical protein
LCGVVSGSFDTSEALLESLNVSHYAQQSLLKALQGKKSIWLLLLDSLEFIAVSLPIPDGGVSEEYIHELVTAIERVNYGQSPGA